MNGFKIVLTFLLRSLKSGKFTGKYRAKDLMEKNFVNVVFAKSLKEFEAKISSLNSKIDFWGWSAPGQPPY